MITLDGYKFYKFYVQLKMHFTDESFDVFKNPNRIKVTSASYGKRRDHGLFERLAGKFHTERDMIQFLVSNFAYSNDQMIWNDIDSGMTNLKTWIRTKESLTKTFSDDVLYIEHLIDESKYSYESIINCTENDTCYIIKLLKSGKIHIETVALIACIEPELYAKWSSNGVSKLVYRMDLLKIKKLIPFIKKNSQIENMWKQFINQYEGNQDVKNI